jgi:superfamily II RNA helicase
MKQDEDKDIYILAKVVDGEKYVFCYTETEENILEVVRRILSFVKNVNLNLTFDDAYFLINRIIKVHYSGILPPEIENLMLTFF